MLTGDNQAAAHALAAPAGIDDVRAELRPEDKVTAIDQLRTHGRTAFLGDGIDDAPRSPPPMSASPWAPPAATSPSKPPM